MKALLITHDQTIKILDSDFDLQTIQSCVGGLIQPIYFGPDNNHFFAYVNEEGKILDLPENKIVTEFWYNSGETILIGDYVAGNVLFFGEIDENGDNTDVPDDVIEFFMLGAESEKL